MNEFECRQAYVTTAAIQERQAILRLVYDFKIPTHRIKSKLAVEITGKSTKNAFCYTKDVRYFAGKVEFAVSEPQLW